MILGRCRGSTLLEALIAATVAILAALAATVYVTRSASYIQWSEDRAFARQKALSILGELRAFVESGGGEAAADLEAFDDGTGHAPTLTIITDPGAPAVPLPPDHPISANVAQEGAWRWYRRIRVEPLVRGPGRDQRLCTVHLFRRGLGRAAPGEEVARVSSVIRTVRGAFPTTQVYDIYVLALENVPGWWVDLDAMCPVVEAAILDLESRNRGLEFRTHWITRLGYGRDDQYAPYTNEVRLSTDAVPWAYVYPGRLPNGGASERYYAPGLIDARLNLDGEATPLFVGDLAAAEPYSDVDGNGRWDPGESFTDSNGDGVWTPNNPHPYALADQHNHCMRWPEARARFDARVAAGLEQESEPTWRLLLDRMMQEPDRYHNAVLLNLHGEVLPMPPVRNVSDAAKDPVALPGWRAVTHPERLRPRRVAGSDSLSDAPRFRVYAWKTRFPDSTPVTTQEEPRQDPNGNGIWDAAEPFVDWNGNGVWDAGLPISLVLPDGDFTARPNETTNPTLRVRCLAGGVDADGSGAPDDYRDWFDAPLYPEAFADASGDGIRQVAEPWLDLDGNGLREANEPYQELDGDGAFTGAAEALTDVNGNGVYDSARPAEPFTDANGNGRWDAAEPYWDYDGDGHWTPPVVTKSPWVAWDPANHGNSGATALYVQGYGEPFLDLDGDGTRDGAEAFFDANTNGVRDGGFSRGEMYFELAYDPTGVRTVLYLHGTPLETPFLDDGSNDEKGLPSSRRLYDLDYVPCPTPDSASDPDRFARDLFHTSGDEPKNTARWIVELPLPAMRTAFETAPGAGDGDQADRILALETRFGTDLTTGVLWPVESTPPNLSVTYAYFYDDPQDVPYSERHLFQGDPRHMPYTDCDATGSTAAHGYNWYFDDFRKDGTVATSDWLAFDGDRLRDGWCARGGGHDVPRFLAWLRGALTVAECVYADVSGRSFTYLSLGGDVGSTAGHGYPSGTPMSGMPFGSSGTVGENTFTVAGSSSICGSVKLVRENGGSSDALRSGGRWWSKPWLGELYPDSAYATQWRPWGNLRAGSGTTYGVFRQIRRGDGPAAQQPRGTELEDLTSHLGEAGGASFFSAGSTSSGFHQADDPYTGSLVGAGPALAEGYGLFLPSPTLLPGPYGLATSGPMGDEVACTDVYPRTTSTEVLRFYDHAGGGTGCGVIRLLDVADASRAANVVVGGFPTTGAPGATLLSRYAITSALHALLSSGLGATLPRARQLPRVRILAPTAGDELDDPTHLVLRWRTTWERWDGLPYTPAYAAAFAEDESDLVYVPMYSQDAGATWRAVLDDQCVSPGVLPLAAGGLIPDPTRTVSDASFGADESLTWSTPSMGFPAGSYLVRIDVHRRSERLHCAYHVEQIHVRR